MGVRTGIRFEREIAVSSGVKGILIVKVPVGTSGRKRFVGGGSVDFLGVVEGVPVALEAKSCRTGRFALSRVSAGQIQFMQRWMECGGFAAVLLRFGTRDTFIVVIPATTFLSWLRAGMKSVTFHHLEKLPRIYRRDGRWQLECLSDIIRRILSNGCESGELRGAATG